MSTKNRKPIDPDLGLTQVGIRLGASHMRMLVSLAAFYGGQTRVFLSALERMYLSELKSNPAFAEFADATDPADATLEE